MISKIREKITKTGKDICNKIKMPQLKLLQRIFLYVIMIVSALLSLIHVSFQYFSKPVAIFLYVLSACSLLLGGYYLTLDLKYTLPTTIKLVFNENPFLNRLKKDHRLKTMIPIFIGMILNFLFALFNGIIAIVYGSSWLGTLSAYYLLLGLMRLLVVIKEHQIMKIEDTK